MGGLVYGELFFLCKKVDAALLAGNTVFGFPGALMTDCLAAGFAYGDTVSFRMIVALHASLPIFRSRFYDWIWKAKQFCQLYNK